MYTTTINMQSSPAPFLLRRHHPEGRRTTLSSTLFEQMLAMQTSQWHNDTLARCLRSAPSAADTAHIAAAPASAPPSPLDERLSEHFTLREFVVSGSAIRHHIANMPRSEHIERLRQLCRQTLEPLRRRFGVLRITSGYRCPELNRIVGGVDSSQHMLGEAADIHVGNREMGERMMQYLRQNDIPFDQVILEHRRSHAVYWLHVSLRSDREGNRRMCLRIEGK